MPECPSPIREYLHDVDGHAVPWNPARWARLTTFQPLLRRIESEHATNKRGLPTISRRFIHALQDEPADQLLVASMVFGFGLSGYGPSRTEKMLAGATGDIGDTRTRLEKIREAARQSPEDGFVALWHAGTAVKHLRTAMGTKFLYFAAGRPTPRMPLILDAVVVAAVEDLAKRALVKPGLTFRPALRGVRTAYSDYLAFAQDVAPKDFATDAVECALFRYGQARKRSKTRTDGSSC
jgi:hypothetical protein